MPARPRTILAALNRVWIDDFGRRFVARSSFGMTTVDAVANDLAANQPLVIGTRGHAMVLTALQYRLADQWRPAQLSAATVRDPWPGRGRRSLSGVEWDGINFTAHVRVESLPEPPEPDLYP